VDYALIGGLAANAHGARANTEDVHACVAVAPDEGGRIEALLRACEDRGFRVNVEAVRKRADAGRTILFLWLGLVRLDVMLRKADGYWDEALAHRRRLLLGGRELWFAAPEDVAILKLAAGRPKDLEAVERMLAVQFRSFDVVRLRDAAARVSARVPELPRRLEAALATAAEIDRAV
jgi:hypothetical protein